MDCICGCGAEIPRNLVPAQLEAGKVALELLVWDRTRTSKLQSAETEALIARGAECYQRLLATLHGSSATDPVPASEEWLEESFLERGNRPEMTDKGGFLRPPKLRVTEEDTERLDRLHPELSFSQPEQRPPQGEAVDEDPVAQLRGLRDLHATGALTDEEFAAAKARVIGRSATLPPDDGSPPMPS